MRFVQWFDCIQSVANWHAFTKLFPFWICARLNAFGNVFGAYAMHFPCAHRRLSKASNACSLCVSLCCGKAICQFLPNRMVSHVVMPITFDAMYDFGRVDSQCYAQATAKWSKHYMLPRRTKHRLFSLFHRFDRFILVNIFPDACTRRVCAPSETIRCCCHCRYVASSWCRLYRFSACFGEMPPHSVFSEQSIHLVSWRPRLRRAAASIAGWWYQKSVSERKYTLSVRTQFGILSMLLLLCFGCGKKIQRERHIHTFGSVSRWISIFENENNRSVVGQQCERTFIERTFCTNSTNICQRHFQTYTHS